MNDPALFRLPRNLVLMAGAGAGKTHALITLALHQLSGAREGGEPLPPAKLVALTFTEKAAAEMKARLRERVRQLADGTAAQEKEPELWASLQALGRPVPDRAFFTRLLEELPLAFVGTFHSYCAQLLRRSPAEAGVDPDFALLEEGEARSLLDGAIEQVLLEALEAGGERADRARRVVGALGFAREGDFGGGAVGALAKIHFKLAEEGREPKGLLRDLPGGDEIARRVAEHRRRVLEAVGGLRPFAKEPKLEAEIRTVRAMSERLLAGADVTIGELNATAATIKLNVGPKAAKDARGAMRESLDDLAECLAEQEEIPLVRAFAGLLADVELRFAEEKRRRAALDFSDLLGLARALLRDHPDVRSEAQSRVGVLLVDELQDTNPLQIDLVALLCERRDGAPRPVEKGKRALDLLPLEPRTLVAVGDRKQSIYEFRGAEVSLFMELAARLREGDEGEVAHLQDNWRSQPRLIALFNRLFARVLHPADATAQPFEVAYVPGEDDLEPKRAATGELPCAELIAVEGENSEEKRIREANALADRLAALLAGDAPSWVGTKEGTRRPCGGDIAILLRRFTHLETYRRALIARAIPFVVVQGRGFYGAQEVLDLASLLSLLDDPDDALAWAAVLRSPLIGITDASLLRLALPGRLSTLREVLAPAWGAPEGLEPFERRALDRFVALYRELAREADRLRPSGCLAAAIEGLELRAVLAAGFQGEQQVANLDKLLDWVRGREQRGVASAGLLARELLELADREPREGLAAALEEGDPRAVRIMTVHQSKGLEFPIVCVPECGAGESFDRASVLYERTLGLSIRPQGANGKRLSTARSSAVMQRLVDRVQAESLRLFYVALTRARDHLILSGEASRSAGSWRAHLDQLLSDPESEALLSVVPGAPAAKRDRLEPPRPPAPAADELDRARAQADRAYAPPIRATRTLVLPVTQALDAAICPRRFFLAHALGLPEHPGRRAPSPVAPGEPAEPSMNAASRGTLAHALLERADWRAVRAGEPGALEAVLAEEGQPLTAEAQEITRDVRAFLEGPLAGQLASLPPERVWRELPFVYTQAVEGLALHLKGQVDLLALLDDGTALVIDYKSAKADRDGAEAYAFQLDCYALAARQLLGGVPVRTGVVFLRDRKGRAIERAPASTEAIEAQLASLARALSSARRADRWPGLERDACRAAGCGYLYRCHTSPRAGETVPARV